MITQKSLEALIDSTLSSITCFHEVTSSDKHLVMFTMFMGGGGFINEGNPTTHGMFSWSFERFETFLNEQLKINKRLCKDINNICLVDVENDSIQDLWEALAYNMAFQIMIVWGYYHINMSDMPRGIEEVREAYFNVWPCPVRDSKNAWERVKELFTV